MLKSITTLAARDWWIAGLILLAAIATRVPGLDHPSEAVHDEVTYMNYTIRTVSAEPYFDIHPPLGRMLFAGIASRFPFQKVAESNIPNAPFDDFPYVPIRLFVALVSLAIPIALYAIARSAHLPPIAAAIPAGLAVFDSSLILYARTMHPDTLLLAFGIGAVAVALSRDLFRERPELHAISVGILGGLAVATKWTGLGLLGVALFVLARSRRSILPIILGGSTALAIYLAVFAAYFFAWYPTGGTIAPEQFGPFADVPGISEAAFPSRIEAYPDAFLGTHRAIWNADRAADVVRTENAADLSRPVFWPLAFGGEFLVWSHPTGNLIIYRGNPFPWTITYLALLAAAIALLARAFVRRAIFSDRERWLGFFVFAFAANYLPFFLIERPMYLYHYMVAALFAYLAAPFAWSEVIAPWLLSIGLSKKAIAALAGGLLLLCGVGFLILAPTTYGFGEVFLHQRFQ
ncbi:MAG TPA: phospholipid carrier-dependent glycosyltransferase [Candidatus Paceibacterota bacterium]|nr:phospholipid carrier-dependent glycosyltransferase [Candidatus Paceibacterota bacterium]